MLRQLMLMLAMPTCLFADTTPSAEQTIEALRARGAIIRPSRSHARGWEVEFQLRGRNLTDDGLALVGKLPNVVSLNLRDTKITGAGLVHLKGLAELRTLHLERTNVDDSGMAHLAGLTNLEYLNLYKTKVTDKGLSHLDKLTKLRKLYLWQTGVTDAGCKVLVKALPDVRISRGVDLSKMPDKEVKKEGPKPVVIKWTATDSDKLPRSKSGLIITVFFENKRKTPVKLYWISYGGEKKLYATLEPGTKRRQNSFSEAVWLITDVDEKPLGYFVTIKAENNSAIIPAEG